MRSERIIILNGASSVGKTSTARALQAIATRQLLYVAMDAFLEMLPARMIGHAEGLVFEPVEDPGGVCLAVRSGPVVERALAGMRRAVAALARAGNSLIVDEVMWGDEAADYRALLADFDLRFVGLFAPLDVLEAREKARGDRDLGLARWQVGRVHRGLDYDLEIDTAAATPEQAAARICEAFGL